MRRSRNTGPALARFSGSASVIQLLAQPEHYHAPLRQIDVQTAVGLSPGLVKRVAGAVPSAEFSVLRAQDLYPLTVAAAGAHAVAMAGEIPVTQIDDGEDHVGVELPDEAEDLVRGILVRDAERVRPQRGVFPPRCVRRGDEPAHLDTRRIAGNAPVEAMIPPLVRAVVPIAP